MELRPYQAEAVEAVGAEWSAGRRSTLLVLPTGCHARGERVMAANGRSMLVEDVKVGDRLMGPDGKPRTVLLLHQGVDDLYRIEPVKGDPFVVNAGHMLSLVRTREKSNPEYPSQMMAGSTCDVAVSDWLGWSKWRKHVHKLYRCRGVERFEGNDGTGLTVDPYFLGVLLGDGSVKGQISVTTMDDEVKAEVARRAGEYGMTLRSEPAGRAETLIMRSGSMGPTGGRLHRELRALGVRGKGSADKEIPLPYLTAPMKQRLELIAGLMDTDGSLSSRCGYDFVSKSEKLARGLAFACRSVGLAAYVSESRKTAQGGFSGVYWRVSVSGECDKIPCRVSHKRAQARRQPKDALRTGFGASSAGRGEYFGFTVDGDNRYLLDDFTVTHNCGKTVCMAEVAKRAVDRGGRVLLLAHRGELLQQAADKIRSHTGLGCAVEKAEETSAGSWYNVVVGSVQTMMRPARLERFPRDRFDVVMVDEAHHAVSRSYRAVLDRFDAARVLGVTATADRGDRRSLAAVFDSVAYEYTLPRAIRDGYLAPIKAQTVPLAIDLSGVSARSGDYAVEELGTALDPYLEQIADEMAASCRDRKTVVFLPLVKTSAKFRAILESRGFRAMEVNGESADRAEVLAAFDAAGPGSVLCNSMLLTEGWDCPSVDCVVVLRPTKVRGLYAQMVGRGTRLSPETGKDDLLLLDFLWHTERHDLVRPASLIAADDDVAEAMTRRLEELPGMADLEEIAEAAAGDVVAQREEALAKELAAMRKRKRKLVDPLQFEMSICAEDLTGYVPSFGWEMAPASPAQIAALERFGIFPDDVECAGKASLLLDRLGKRRDEGMSTPRQIRYLEQRGFKGVGTWSKDDASRMMTRISANGWRVPRGIDPTTYAPGR